MKIKKRSDYNFLYRAPSSINNTKLIMNKTDIKQIKWHMRHVKVHGLRASKLVITR